MAEQDQFLPQLKELVAQSIEGQWKAFLRAFVGEFSGKFEQVLDQVEDFKKALPPNSTDGQLDEHQAHIFLEKKGEAQTVVEFREKMKLIDIDFNRRISVIEYLLYKYNKTTKDLFEAKPNAALVKKLEDAIDKYLAVFRARKEREDKIASLEAIVKQGGKEAAKAKAELMGLKMQDPSKDASNEIGSLAEKLRAKRALANPEEENRRLQQQEEERLAEEKRKKEDEEKRKQQESRNKLKDRAKLWN
eukprot:TRINITY_DN3536_c0_g1_i1.p1 TRINITY_DN3536_c0_g1~~TRINITY_DN3536_c0_g1_i1.p1  ORF type:complete len:247 (+),score=169.25 TRINITY_DN3536_c0_g1_i1:19-759(+)